MEELANSRKGFIDIYSYHGGLRAWVFVGWLSRSLMSETAAQLNAVFSSSTLSGSGILSFFERPDLGEVGIGVVILVPGESKRGALRACSIEVDGGEIQLSLKTNVDRFSTEQIQSYILELYSGPQRALDVSSIYPLVEEFAALESSIPDEAAAKGGKATPGSAEAATAGGVAASSQVSQRHRRAISMPFSGPQAAHSWCWVGLTTWLAD